MLRTNNEEAIAWKYEMRRDMQEVYEGVYLGPQSVASKSKLTELQRSGITHIVCVRYKGEENMVKPNFEGVIRYEVVTLQRVPPLADASQPDPYLQDSLWRATQFIRECVTGGGRCLVCCFSGQTLSTIVVLAYIIATAYCSPMYFSDAHRLVLRKRYCITVEPYYSAQLECFEQSVNNQEDGGVRKKQKIDEGNNSTN